MYVCFCPGSGRNLMLNGCKFSVSEQRDPPKECVSPTGTLLPVEVRCYISWLKYLARNARCNTMSHLTIDAVFSHMSLCSKHRCRFFARCNHLTIDAVCSPDVTPCHTSPPQGVLRKRLTRAVPYHYYYRYHYHYYDYLYYHY